jgi:hypothetical protein
LASDSSVFCLFLILSLYPLPYATSSHNSCPASWNWGILPDRIIHLLASWAPLGVSNKLVKTNWPPWASLRPTRRSASCRQCNKMCLGVSGPVPQLHCSDSYPGTLALCRKCPSLVRPVRSCTSIALSALQRFSWSWRIVGSGGLLIWS